MLAIERALNARETKHDHPEIGEDIKVMGVRHEKRIDLTVGCAFVARYVADLDDYARKKSAARELAIAAALRTTTLEVAVTVNAADDFERGDIFLTVTGTSAEAGDDGEVGRGNRVNGLITPYRPMTLEAAAGKNPISHVGKLYNLVASRIASSVTTQIGGVDDAACILVSQIGRSIDDPQLVDVMVPPASADASRAAAIDIVEAELGRMSSLREELLAEQTAVY